MLRLVTHCKPLSSLWFVVCRSIYLLGSYCQITCPVLVTLLLGFIHPLVTTNPQAQTHKASLASDLHLVLSSEMVGIAKDLSLKIEDLQYGSSVKIVEIYRHSM